MHILAAMKRKLTATMNKSSLNAVTTVTEFSMLSVRNVFGLGLRTVQVGTYNYNKYSLISQCNQIKDVYC